MKSLQPLDVWDFNSFDAELLDRLTGQANLIRSYLARDQEICLEYNLGRSPSLIRPANAWAAPFQWLNEQIGSMMASRVIRAWHYTRLTDHEAAAMKRDGLHLSTTDTLRARLKALVAAELLDQEQADSLHKESRIHNKDEYRHNKFWMVSHPLSVLDSGVEPLLAYWGGEVAAFRPDLPELIEPLTKIGRPRVVEIAMPLSNAADGYSHYAGKAVVATFGRALGAVTEKCDFDLYAITALSPAAVMAIHTEGDDSFPRIGVDFPSGFIDIAPRYRKELTGEDDG